MNKNKTISTKLQLKKVVVKSLNTRTGIKALGGSVSNNSCTNFPHCMTK